MEPHSEKKGRLGDKFEGFQHAPGEDVWERIAATPTDRPLGARFRGFAVLPRRRVWRNISAVLHPQVQRRAIVWWSAAAGAAILLGLGLLWQSPSGATAKRFAATQWQEPIPTQPNGNPGTLPTNAIPTDGAPSTAATLSLQSNTPINHLTDNGFRNPKDQSTRKPDAVGSMEPSIAGTMHTDDAASLFADGEKRFVALTVRESGSLMRPGDEISSYVAFWQTMGLEAANAEALQLDLDIQADLENSKLDARQSTFAQAGSNLTSGNVSFGTRNFSNNEGAFQDGGASPLLSNESHSSGGEEGENYKSPLVFALLLDRGIAKGFGVSGGLVYTQLQSYRDGLGGNYVHRLDATRHYLGLATSGTYTLPLGKKFATYASTGLQFDLGVGHKRVVTARRDETLVAKEEIKGDNGHQMSANLGLGIRYNILKRVGLYAQGTAAHYFLQSEDNLWSTKKVWPMLQVGVRMSL